MLEFANTTPANGKNKRGNLCKRARCSSASRTHTQKKMQKSRFGVRVKGSRNLRLTEGAEQSFVFWNGMCGKATGGARRSLSRLVTWS